MEYRYANEELSTEVMGTECAPENKHFKRHLWFYGSLKGIQKKLAPTYRCNMKECKFIFKSDVFAFLPSSRLFKTSC